MREKSESPPPPALQGIAQAFRLAGWISFWIQLVLGVVSTLALLSASFGRNVNAAESTVGTGFGIVLAVSGVVTLGIGIYLAFRYTRLAKRLQSAYTNQRPRKADTLQILRLGLIINLVGMLLTILGAQAIVGVLLVKSLSLPQVGAIYSPNQVNQAIRPLDILVVQANTNTVAAHFVGLLASLWLLNRINRS